MVSINEVQDTNLDFSELDMIYKRVSYLASPTGVYPLYNENYAEISDNIHHLNNLIKKYKDLISSIKDMNSSETKNIEQISNVIKISFECIITNIFYLKSIGVPVTSCWEEFVQEMSSRRINSDHIKNIFKEKPQYNADIEGALLGAIEERKKLLKLAADLSNKLNNI